MKKESDVSDHRPLCKGSAIPDPLSSEVSDLERLAVERVRRARVKAPESAILAFVRCSGPESILATKLRDINAIANAF